MNNNDTSNDGHLVMLAVIGTVILPVLYVLSIGPAAAITHTCHLPSKPVKAFYAPVKWLHDHTPLEQPLEDYIRWWGVNP